jgi:ribosomal protein S18 acetylase RimI-like enzyme
VEKLAVSPAFQRRGLGSQLMAHAEVAALSLGHERIRLFTNKRFAENVLLYHRLGYRVDGEENLGGETIGVDMSKALRKSPWPRT